MKSNPTVRRFPAAVLSSFCIFLFVFQVESQVDLQVGYAVLTAEPGSAVPVAAALFSYRNAEGVLVSEAAVAAVEPIPAGRLFVNQAEARTGLALVNPYEEPVTLDLILRGSNGLEFDSAEQILEPHQHLPRFVDELFPDLPVEFVGSLTFRSREQDRRVAAVTLRQGENSHLEPLLATLPVAELSEPSSNFDSAGLVFPHIGAGPAGSLRLSTQIILINRTGQLSTGEVHLVDSDGLPLEMDVDGRSVNSFHYVLQGHGVFQEELKRSSEVPGVGYARVTVGQGATPAGTALFQYRAATGQLISEAGVGAIAATTEARIFVDTVGTQTGFALANAGNDATTVQFELLDRNGFSVDTATVDLAAAGHTARFVDQLFADLPTAFTGLLEIHCADPIVPITLKLTQNERNEPILTTLPVADLTRPGTSTALILPQLGFGQGFQTRLILLNPDDVSPIRGTLRLVQSDGSPLLVRVGGESTDTLHYWISEKGGQQMWPGQTGVAARIYLDPTQFYSGELVVSVGNTVAVRAQIIDSNGLFRDDFEIGYASLDDTVATIDPNGHVTAHRAGFSTLTVASEGLVEIATITAVEVTSGVGGLKIDGIAQDFAGRLYLASGTSHTVLRAENIESIPVVYAGISSLAGYRDDRRLNALFDHPTYLALNHAQGQLYVSDRENHAIRLVQPGARGEVETLAGTGQAGSTDGFATQARFHSPQGVALDNRGNLWVADTGNHIIRRINLVAREVETIAGQAGKAGDEDGSGSEVRFNLPTGIAVEREPLHEQLAREARGDPPPPVSCIVADAGNGLLRRVHQNGMTETLDTRLTTSSWDGASRPTSQGGADLENPTAVAVDAVGNIYVSDAATRQVKLLLRTGGLTLAAQAGTFTRPGAMAITENGRLAVADGENTGREIVYGAPRIDSVTPGTVSTTGGDEVTIRGGNFASDTLVTIADSVIDSVQIMNTGTLRFTVPELPNGPHTLTVQTRGGLVQALFSVVSIPLAELPPGYITTVAGSANLFAGDGQEATIAILKAPDCVSFDGAGNFFITDQYNHRIRRVDGITGTITTVAGTGDEGFSGDGGLATAATLTYPEGVALDSAGNLYIADQGNDRVRRVDAATGIITTVAGSGRSGFSGDGGPATEAALDWPEGLAFDHAGNLFIAAMFNNRIRRVDAVTGVITTVAGTGEKGFSGDGGPATEAALNSPHGIAFDSAGNLFIADGGNNRIRKVDAVTNLITTVAGTGSRGFSGDGGPATQAQLNYPDGIALDSAGNLYIADEWNDRIRKVDGATGIITTVAGAGDGEFSGDGGPATEAFFLSPSDVSVDFAGSLFVADKWNHRIRKIDSTSGIINTVAGSGEESLGDGGPATMAGLNLPVGVAVDQADNIFITDYLNNRVRRVDGRTGVVTTVAGTGQMGFSGDGGPATEASLAWPQGVAVDFAGDLFIADSSNGHIRRVDAGSGIINTVAGTGKWGFSGDGGPATEAELNSPEGIAVDRDGNLYIADQWNQRIRKVHRATGIITTVAGSGPTGWGNGGFSGDGGQATVARLLDPEGVALDESGNLLIADTGNDRVRKVDGSTGVITTVVGGGASGDGSPATEASLTGLWGMVVDHAGNLFIADSVFNRVRVVEAATGTISTVVGSGEEGFSGDGGPAAEATLDYPVGLALDSEGNLLVADLGNNRIRAVRGPLVSGNNSAPVANAGPDQVVAEGDLTTLDGRDSFDPDGDPLTYQWTQMSGPSVSLSGAATAVASFVAPEVEDIAYLAFRFRVSDGIRSSLDYAYITVLDTNALPNLTVYQPSGWSDKIVVSRVSGTNIDSSNLSSSDTLYVDHAILNSGSGPTTARFYTDLYVDGVYEAGWYFDPPLNPNYYTYAEDYTLGPLSSGTHTLTIETDTTGSISESSEEDNQYTRTITIQ